MTYLEIAEKIFKIVEKTNCRKIIEKCDAIYSRLDKNRIEGIDEIYNFFVENIVSLSINDIYFDTLVEIINSINYDIECYQYIIISILNNNFKMCKFMIKHYNIDVNDRLDSGNNGYIQLPDSVVDMIYISILNNRLIFADYFFLLCDSEISFETYLPLSISNGILLFDDKMREDRFYFCSAYSLIHDDDLLNDKIQVEKTNSESIKYLINLFQKDIIELTNKFIFDLMINQICKSEMRSDDFSILIYTYPYIFKKIYSEIHDSDSVYSINNDDIMKFSKEFEKINLIINAIDFLDNENFEKLVMIRN